MVDVNSLLSAGGGALNTDSTASQATKKLVDDFDTFLVMLVTQLQNQDPLEPTDSSEFTNQLVQFTSVEQQITANQNLEDLATLTMMNGINSSVNFIGKTINSVTPETAMRDGEAVWKYSLRNDAYINTIHVEDHLGRTVYTTDGELTAGENTFTWDGTDGEGGTLPEGLYTLKVSAKDLSGSSVISTVYIEGVVDGVDMIGGQSLLSVNGMSIPVGAISQVKNTTEDIAAGA
jgi:flagellar basal-body rod modification protein FlgD